MTSRLSGAVARAILVVMFVMTPGLMLPGAGDGMSDVVALVAVSAAGITFLEYQSSYPSVIEFRDAPPYNRVRFGAVFVTMGALCLVSQNRVESTLVTDLLTVLGVIVGWGLDLPFTPVRNILLSLPPEATAEDISFLRAMAGLSYAGSLTSIALFAGMSRGMAWPGRNTAFNVWTNLPTFDPTAGGDVVHRLNRDARIYLLLGILLPFVIPVGLQLLGGLVTPLSSQTPQSLVWTLILWAFLPSSLVMRAVALRRVARLIDGERRRRYAEVAEEAALA